MFLSIFNTDFHIGFYLPKKDDAVYAYECIELSYLNFLNWKLLSSVLAPKKVKLILSLLQSAYFNKNNFKLTYGLFEKSNEKTFDFNFAIFLYFTEQRIS